MTADPGARRERVAALAERARTARDEYDPPPREQRPDEEAASEALVDGLEAVLSVYVAARTDDAEPPLDEGEAADLERACNDWLAVYCAAHGADFDPEFTVRETAELLVETRNVRVAAQLLTGVPDRDRSEPWGGFG